VPVPSMTPFTWWSEVRSAWSVAWPARRLRVTVLATAVGAAISPFLLPRVITAVSNRPGRVPPDPLLAHLGPASESTVIMLLLGGTIMTVLVSTLRRPVAVSRGAFAVVLLFLIRGVTMTLVPLAAPPGIIALRDPLDQLLFYPGGEPATRRVWAHVLVAAAAASVALLLLIQHAHWTVDVAAAPVFALLVWWLSGFALREQPPAAVVEPALVR
jgi:hypothetical protein